MSERMHSTSTAAQAAGVSESFVRRAAARGLIQPRRNELGWRVLSDADVAKLRELRNARGVAA